MAYPETAYISKILCMHQSWVLNTISNTHKHAAILTVDADVQMVGQVLSRQFVTQLQPQKLTGCQVQLVFRYNSV